METGIRASDSKSIPGLNPPSHTSSLSRRQGPPLQQPRRPQILLLQLRALAFQNLPIRHWVQVFALDFGLRGKVRVLERFPCRRPLGFIVRERFLLNRTNVNILSKEHEGIQTHRNQIQRLPRRNLVQPGRNRARSTKRLDGPLDLGGSTKKLLLKLGPARGCRKPENLKDLADDVRVEVVCGPSQRISRFQPTPNKEPRRNSPGALTHTSISPLTSSAKIAPALQISTSAP